jgi:purine-binding chemotaxis protein CheW
VSAFSPAEPVVAFAVGGEEFGVPVGSVHQVLRDQELSAAPDELEFLEGVVRRRGWWLPVLDLRRRLGMPIGEGQTRLLVVSHPLAGRVALRVDGVRGVEPLPGAAIHEPPRYFAGRARNCVRGLIRSQGRMLILLRVEALLSAPEVRAIRALAEREEETVHPADERGERE